MRLSDVPVGTRVILRENMDGGTGMIRETHYVRVGGDARYPSNVPVARVRAMQGIPGERLIWDTGERHAWSEATAAIQVLPASEAILLPQQSAPEEAAPNRRRITLIADPIKLFDSIMAMKGDCSSLGTRVFTAFMDPKDSMNLIGLLAAYGIEVETPDE